MTTKPNPVTPDAALLLLNEGNRRFLANACSLVNS